MNLSQKQKEWLNKNRKKLTAQDVAKELKISVEEAEKILKSDKSNRLIFYVIMFLIPIIFFVLLEAGLRVFNYGQDIPQWVDAGRGKLIINPEVARRYFSHVKNIPTTIEDVFDKEKKPNSFRVFVLGGSSAAGFPYMPMGSFSRYIRKRLELNYPNTTIEVVNIGLSAVNTYTLLDLVPGVIEQKPDLVLIYAGHNEYYGALGAGSMESLGTSRTVVKLLLQLNKYKTVQLVRDILSSVISTFSSENANDEPGTLMSRMAKDQYIEFNSDKYVLGLEQFEGNMRDILDMLKENNIPVVVGKLVSNLKDQKPFVSMQSEKYPSAQNVFDEANKKLNEGRILEADSLFRLAKDLDGLRFRASEEINSIIENLSAEYNLGCVETDSIFNVASPLGVVGDNLMTDHLHPNIAGYLLMGKAFYDIMDKKKYLPENLKPVIAPHLIDNLARAGFQFTDLDSLIGNNRIALLKNDWPFIDKSQAKQRAELFSPKNFIDSFALEVMNNKVSWADAHLKTAAKYFSNRDVAGFLKHMDILIYQYPIVVEYYDETALSLLRHQFYDLALKYLSARYKIEPSDYSAKWLGNIALFKGDAEVAAFYLNKSQELNNKDSQVYYNLAGAYAKLNEYQKALDAVNKCLNLTPNYPAAQNLKQQLSAAVGRN